MPFSKTLHWGGTRAMESVMSNHVNLRNGVGESRATYMFALSHGKRLWETTEWGCVENPLASHW